jgi:hypothetical protein
LRGGGGEVVRLGKNGIVVSYARDKIDKRYGKPA